MGKSIVSFMMMKKIAVSSIYPVSRAKYQQGSSEAVMSTLSLTSMTFCDDHGGHKIDLKLIGPPGTASSLQVGFCGPTFSVPN